MHLPALQRDDRDHACFDRKGCGGEGQQFGNARTGKSEEQAEERMLGFEPIDHRQYPRALFAIDVFAFAVGTVEARLAIPPNGLIARNPFSSDGRAKDSD